MLLCTWTQTKENEQKVGDQKPILKKYKTLVKQQKYGKYKAMDFRLCTVTK